MFEISNTQRTTLFPASLFEAELQVSDETNLSWKTYIETHLNQTGEENLALTDTTLQTVEIFRPLVDTILHTAQGIMEHLGYEKQNLEVSALWGNRQLPNGRHRVHSHPNNWLSFCYYVETGQDDFLTFHDFRPEHVIPKISNYTDYNASNINISVHPKKLLIWPSWIKHEVIENPNYRISIGGNVRFPPMLEAGPHGCMAQ